MLKLFKNLGKKEILYVIICTIFIVVQVFLDLKIPDYMANITVLVQENTNNISDILKQGSYMVMCAFGSLTSAIIIGYLAAYIGTSFERKLREKIFLKVQSFSMQEIKQFSTSSLITRNTNDVTQIKMFIILGIQMLLKAPIMASMAITKIANKGFEFSIITTIGVIIILCLITFLIILVLPKFKIIQSLTDNLNKITRENLNGIRVIRAYNASNYHIKRFNSANNDLTNTNLFIQKSMALLSPVMSTVMSGISLSIYWVGAYLINEANMLDKINIFGNMVVFSSYAIQVILSFMMIVMLFVLYPRASVSARRINEVLDTKESIKNGLIKSDTTSIKGEIEFRNVSFKYPDAEEYVLKDISFKALNGQTIAFIGSTGSGKSTLINLIPRFYDVSDGEILIDGVNIKDMDLDYLYSKLGYVSQKAVIFKNSVKNNVLFGNKIGKKPNKKALESALEISQSNDFVDKLDNKVNTLIAQGGTNISGGQKQRLSIARAIAREPEIFLFDDSFSALDYKTDFILRKELNKKCQNATKLIVAQRIGTIKDADQILVIDNGKCVGIGTHEELLNSCKVYQEIANSQLSKEELKNA